MRAQVRDNVPIDAFARDIVTAEGSTFLDGPANFYRIGRSETQGRRGSGVGLALVKHIVEAHGGRVSVESRLGEGSRFTLHLPVREPCPES